MTPMYHLFHLRTEELRGVSGLSGIQTRYNAPFIYQSPSTLFNGDFSNGYLSGIRPTYNLPFDDQSQYISGFLSGYVIPAETLRRIKEHNFTVRSEYYLGQHILEDYEPKTDEPFILKELYGYNITLSGPGFNNTNNHSRFEINGASGRWEKLPIKDNLTIKPDFTWERSKEIDTDFFLRWKGTYSYISGYNNNDCTSGVSGDYYNKGNGDKGLLVFSLSGKGQEYTYSGETIDDIAPNYQPYYGLMYGPIDNIHVFKDPVKAVISGVITDSIQQEISGTISDNASGVLKGVGKGKAQGTAYATFNDNVSVQVYGVGYGYTEDCISGFGWTIGKATGEGPAYNTRISGRLLGLAHSIFSNAPVIISGVGIARDVYAESKPTTFTISGEAEGFTKDVLLKGEVTQTADGVMVGGYGTGVAEQATLSCQAEGSVSNITICGDINEVVNDYVISGVISEIVNGTVISGMASGYANNVTFNSSSSVVLNNYLMKGEISQVVNNIPIAGEVRQTVNGVNVSGPVEGTQGNFEISTIAYKDIPNNVLSGYINGEVKGPIRNTMVDILSDDFIDASIISDFKTGLFDRIGSNLTINDYFINIHDYFGVDTGIVLNSLNDAINRIIDYNSIYNIMAPIYLSTDAAYDLTDKLLSDITAVTGAYIKGAIGIQGTTGTINEDNATIGDRNIYDKNSVSLAGTVDENVSVPARAGSIDSGQSTDGSTGHTHDMWGNETGHTHPIGGKSVTVGSTTGKLKGTLDISNGNITISNAAIDAAITGGNIYGAATIKGANINQFRTLIYSAIIGELVTMMFWRPFDKIVYENIDEYVISAPITGIITGIVDVNFPSTQSGIVPGTGVGYVNQTISGTITNSVTHSISGIVYNQVSGEVKGFTEGIASTLAFVVGEGMPTFDDKIILSAFIDDSFSDMTNFYKISGSSGLTDRTIIDGKWVSGSILSGIDDIINPGGRGQLINHVGMNLKQYYDIIYSVGSYEDKTNTIVKDNSGFILTATSGFETEYTPLNNNFGRDGGNIVQNSFDLYQKNEPENGFARIIYGLDHFNTLEITASGTIEVLPDEPASIDASGIIYNQVLANNEAEVYYRITRRGQELNLDESTFNGKKLSEYTIKYEEPEEITPEMSYNEIQYLFKRKYKKNELYITAIDNQRRRLTFLTPSRSVNNDYTIQLYLEAGKRKFYFAIVRDNNIDTVIIDDKEYFIEDQEEDGSYRRHKIRNKETDIIELGKDGNPIYDDDYYGLTAGATINDVVNIEVTFKNENDSLMKEVIRNYLNDCFDFAFNPNSISKSNNFVQTIRFRMPQRDVLLFLKTEKTYMLNIFVDEESTQIIEVQHYEKKYDDEVIDIISKEENIKLPIIVKHFWDDMIEIRVKFDNPFVEIDRDYLQSQLIDVPIIRYNDGERVYTSFEGYDTEIYQVIRFFMPARDVTLYLRETDYRYNLKLLREIETTHFENANISVDNPNKFIPKETENVIYNSTQWLTLPYKAGEKIDITVIFIPETPNVEGSQGFYYEIDQFYLKSQMASIGIDTRKFIEDKNKYLGYNGPFQKFSFTMPANDVELVIKEKGLLSNLTIKPEQYQYENAPDNARPIKGVIVKGIDYIFTTHEGMKIPVVHGEPLDIFVFFSDIYQHLDVDYVISQDPTLVTVPAGEFGFDVGGQPLTIPSTISNDRTKDELYQYLRFRMPEEDFTLVLKWVERLFKIEFDIQSLYFDRITIKDSNRLVNLDEPPKEKQITMRQSTFPRYTYPTVANDRVTTVPYTEEPNIGKVFRQNTISIISKLKPYMRLKTDNNEDELEYNTSYFQIGHDDAGKIRIKQQDYEKDVIVPPNDYGKYGITNFDSFIAEWDEPSITMPFYMPKNDVKFVLNIGMNTSDDPIIIKQYGEGELFLDAGWYTFMLFGADGGIGGGGGGSGAIGGHWQAELFFPEAFSITYKLGGKGFNGTAASGDNGSGGGGGGGTSILEFDAGAGWYIPGTTSRAVYCYGGWGGNGDNGDGKDPQDGGGGGAGGGYADLTGNGSDGSPGEVAGGLNVGGDMGGGGTGGMGWERNDRFIPYLEVGQFERHGNAPGGILYSPQNGYLYIKFTREYVEQ